MGKVIKFKISEKIFFKQSMREAKKEFEFLFKITGGQPGMAPSWLLGMDEETYEKWENGDIEV
jgi:hypothetical protein